MSVRRNVLQILAGQMMGKKKPPLPVHVEGTERGEQAARKKGKEPGRQSHGDYRTARDSTGINAKAREPVHPDSPNIPPV